MSCPYKYLISLIIFSSCDNSLSHVTSRISKTTSKVSSVPGAGAGGAGAPFGISCTGQFAYEAGEQVNLRCVPNDSATTSASLFKVEANTCPEGMIEIDPESGIFKSKIVPANFNACKVTVVTGKDNTWCQPNDGSCRASISLPSIAMLAEINSTPNGASSSPSILEAVNGKNYFLATNARTCGLYVTDGTENGTVLVKNLPAGPSCYGISKAYGSKLIFEYSSFKDGSELWITDGTSLGTVMLKDINPGVNSSNPSNFAVFNNLLYFTASTPNEGNELWRTDGTLQGTVLVTDLKPGTGSGLMGYNSSCLQLINGSLFFWADDGVYGTELWRSNGTPDGTYIVKDITPGSIGSGGSCFQRVGGKFFFIPWTFSGYELWRSEGTDSSTYMVKDIHPTNTAVDFSFGIQVLNGLVIIKASNGTDGDELWKSDGTEAGTVMIDNAVGTGGANQGSNTKPIVIGNYLYYRAQGDSNGQELWRTDGSVRQMVADLAPGSGNSFPDKFYNFGGTLVFSASPVGYDWEPFLFDPAIAANDAACVAARGPDFVKSTTTGGCIGKLKNINSSTSSNFGKQFTINGKLMFVADDGIVGEELWTTDGTTAGTKLIKNLNESSADSSTGTILKFGDKLYFSGFAPSTGDEIYEYDSVTKSLVLVKDYLAGTNGFGFYNPIIFKNQIFYTGSGGATYAYDPNVAATNDAECAAAKGSGFVLAATGRGCLGSLGSSNASNEMFPIGDYLYFTGQAGGDIRFWATDGTLANTGDMININPSGYDYAYFKIELNGALLGTVDAGSSSIGNELFKYDPTPAISSAECVSMHGSGYVKTNRSPGCLGPLADIRPGSSSSYPNNFVRAGNRVYFYANDGINGTEIWSTDGTGAGTVMLKNLAPGSDSPQTLNIRIGVGSKLFFTTGGNYSNGFLWVYDPAPSVDSAACELKYGIGSSKPETLDGCIVKLKEFVNSSQSAFGSFVTIGASTYFTATTPEFGFELWKSDGTASGTVMVKDIAPGPLGSTPERLTVIDDKLMFTAFNSESGRELWQSEGDAASTYMVREFISGDGGNAYGSVFTVIGKDLYFGAATPKEGVELRKLTLP